IVTPLKLPAGTYPGIRLSPNGKRVAFWANTGKGFDVFVYDTESDRKTQLTLNGQDNRDSLWAPDGEHIAFDTSAGIWWTRADGGSDPQLLVKTANRAFPSSFSHDGKFLA